jgi:hypothetical protein
LGDQIEENEMGETCGTCARIGGDKTDGKGPLGRPGGRWEFEIKLDHKEVRWVDVDLIDVSQDRNKWKAVVNAINPRVP